MKPANRAALIYIVSSIVSFGLAACGASTSATPAPDADPLAPDADPVAPDARPGTPDARPAGGAPDAAPAAIVATCLHTCGQASDCVVAGSTLYDVDNWSCTSGICNYLGCNSDSECQTTLQNQAYSCKATAATGGLRTCLHTCGAPADCATAGVAIYSASHWTCDSGTCTYLGCQSAGECQSTFMSTAYTCAPTAGSIPICQRTCGSAGDCVIAGSTLYDADNWNCKSGICQWDGCNSDSECSSTFMNSAYVCRAE